MRLQSTLGFTLPAFALLTAALFAAESRAACACRCVEGQMQPLCDTSIDIPPICSGVCALPPASIKPIQPLAVPPLGTSQCSQRQVVNPNTRRYEWASVCE
jgi:hypothetical protein